MINLENIDKPVNLTEGEWVGDIPEHPGVSFRVRSRNYRPFRAAMEKYNRSFGRRIHDVTGTPQYQAGLGERIAEHLLLDWENAVMRGKDPVPYDAELALKLLTMTDDRNVGQTFRDNVSYAAGVVADRLLGIGEDASGN